MFGLGTTELLVILAIAVLVFGARRLPELGKGLGQGMRSFRDALRGEDKAERSDLSNQPNHLNQPSNQPTKQSPANPANAVKTAETSQKNNDND